ncbi:excinuclease ABC subunit B [Salipiger sp. 1_MG-2023]|uniref:excinuclease ABC subunit B n=1 Tax=Salipiger sp. 1_MG-2023 TaxID=3062665 RepID=UPI0026E2EE03|nr:excinuclease ABC subunit B [Salipiger sp. 1_MG-2023]MDO6588193.1 excinuclease ABC subunit B [Salipiger sp. 1_MG-2023]
MSPRLTLTMAAVALLSACATPREACLNAAAGPWRSAMKERQRIAADLARGYTFETRYERHRVLATCRGPGGARYACWDSRTEPVTRREPVDRAALLARDRELQRALPVLRSEAARDSAQCRATYPAPE